MAKDFYYSNEVLKTLIQEYGDRIFMIQLDNGHKIFFGTPQGKDNVLQVEDLEFRTIDGCDMFGIRRVDHTWGNSKDGVPWLQWWTTAFVQTVCITEAPLSPSGDYWLPDLNKFF